MASVYNYTFDNLSRIGEDTCYLSERNKQNIEYANYNVTNYFTKNCGLAGPLELSTRQPNIFIKDGFGPGGPGGCNIDKDSELRIGTIQTNPKCRISLQTRPFATVPYLGRGPARPVEESRLQQSDRVSNKKSYSTTTEISHMDYRHYPLIPSLRATVTNPKNLIEEVAVDGWVRGGLPTRDLIRDQDYARRHIPQ
jgi:hypothetical protein